MTRRAFIDKFSSLLTHSENGVEGQETGKENGARLCFPLNFTGGGQTIPSLALGLTSSLSLGPLPRDSCKLLPRSLDGSLSHSLVPLLTRAALKWEVTPLCLLLQMQNPLPLST